MTRSFTMISVVLLDMVIVLKFVSIAVINVLAGIPVAAVLQPMKEYKYVLQKNL